MALLELDGLTRRFGGLIAVNRVSMQVAEGEVRAVIGPNGAGKSTLFNLITGIIKPSDGTVRFAGERLTGLPVPRICQRGIARTFQLTALSSAAARCSPKPAGGPIWRSNVSGDDRAAECAACRPGARASALVVSIGPRLGRRPPGRLPVAWRPAAARSRDGVGTNWPGACWH
jgi:energy-coupling factor transporter ATP-binding protein EcfA2